jgi:hypothetical protein
LKLGRRDEQLHAENEKALSDFLKSAFQFSLVPAFVQNPPFRLLAFASGLYLFIPAFRSLTPG